MGTELAIFVGLLLLAGNAFFVGAEFSIIAVRRSSIEPAAARGNKRAKTTLGALENVSFLLAGAQLGITLCSLGLGAVAEPALAHLIESPLHALHVPDALLHPIAFALALSIVVFLHVVVGEMVPKNVALAKPERTSLLLTPALVFISSVFRPIVHGLNVVAASTLNMVGVEAKDEVSSTYTRDEMADLVKESRKEGYLSEDNEHLLSGALSFDTRSVGDVVIPRDSLVTVEKQVTPAYLEALSTQTGFSRFPVIDKKQQITGYVHIKDAIQVDTEDRDQPIQPRFVRKLVSVNANQSIRMTLKTMQRSGAHLALVVRGKKVLGIVTLEDVLEELVGES